MLVFKILLGILRQDDEKKALVFNSVIIGRFQEIVNFITAR